MLAPCTVTHTPATETQERSSYRKTRSEISQGTRYYCTAELIAGCHKHPSDLRFNISVISVLCFLKKISYLEKTFFVKTADLAASFQYKGSFLVGYECAKLKKKNEEDSKRRSLSPDLEIRKKWGVLGIKHILL
jgi:hypothetical protein